MAISSNRIAQSSRDAEAREAAARTNPERVFDSLVHTAPPVYREDSNDQWGADVNTPMLIPIELGVGHHLVFHSFRTVVRTTPAVSNPVQYQVALYEAMPGAVGSLASPSSGDIQVRLLDGTQFTRNLVVDPADPTVYIENLELSNDILLLPTKQYFVWVYTNSVLIEFLRPSALATGFGILETFASDRPPTRARLARREATTSLRAPLVTLRARYGSFFFGDPSRE